MATEAVGADLLPDTSALVPARNAGRPAFIRQGHFRYELRGWPPDAAAAAVAAYPDSGPSDPALPIDFRCHPAPAFLATPKDADGIYRLTGADRAGGYRAIYTHRYAGFYRPAAAGPGAGAIFAAASPVDLAWLPVAFENFLRFLAAAALPEQGGVLLHAAGILDGIGRAHVFFGPSGAGKTTVTELSLPRRVLSDDLVVLWADDPPAAGPSLFRGSYQGAIVRDGRFPLAAIHRIVKDHAVSLTPMSRAAALASLTASLPFLEGIPSAYDAALGVLHGVLARVPADELRFPRSAALWQSLEPAP